MLIPSLLPDPAEGALSVSKICNQDFIFHRMPADERWEECPHSDKHDQGGSGELVRVVEKNSNDFSSLILPSCSQVSISNTMSGSLTPLRVYHRKKLHTYALDICLPQASVYNKNGEVYHSAYSSEAHSRATKEHLVPVEAETGSPCKSLVNTDGLASKSGSFNGCSDGEEPDEVFGSDSGRVLDICGIDDSCSSSKFNLDFVSASLKTDGDDSAECSSSGALVSEGLWENMSERDICISIIRSHGLVETASCQQDCISAGNFMTSDDNICSRTCKVCGHSDTSSKMLICDQCEDAFHTSCCIPRLTRIPTDEWFCYSCLKKKCKILKGKSCTAPANISNKDELGPIAHILRDTRPFKSSVQIGDEYQVDVPDWSGPVITENAMSEPEELKESKHLVFYGDNSNKALQLSSIGNWLQCQEIIEGIGEDIDGTICGKWRRAPLFESQTEDWECYRTVLWDPVHADCAVPQELPTDEVLKQLKYIEMLKPRLGAKRQKLDQTDVIDSEAPKQTQ